MSDGSYIKVRGLVPVVPGAIIKMGAIETPAITVSGQQFPSGDLQVQTLIPTISGPWGADSGTFNATWVRSGQNARIFLTWAVPDAQTTQEASSVTALLSPPAGFARASEPVGVISSENAGFLMRAPDGTSNYPCFAMLSYNPQYPSNLVLMVKPIDGYYGNAKFASGVTYGFPYTFSIGYICVGGASS